MAITEKQPSPAWWALNSPFQSSSKISFFVSWYTSRYMLCRLFIWSHWKEYKTTSFLLLVLENILRCLKAASVLADGWQVSGSSAVIERLTVVALLLFISVLYSALLNVSWSSSLLNLIPHLNLLVCAVEVQAFCARVFSLLAWGLVWKSHGILGQKEFVHKR